MREKREETAFRKGQDILSFLQQKEDKKLITLYYFDESGFSMNSCIPYAWQRRGETRELPKQRSKRLNVLGFLNRSHHSYFHTVEGSVKSAEVVSIFDAFTEAYDDEYQQTKVPCMVVLDNASMHRSQEFKDKIEYWESKAVFLHFLPAYSPELNLIEILWRKIKVRVVNLRCLSKLRIFKAECAYYFGFYWKKIRNNFHIVT